MKKRISVIGLGWLGLPLARSLYNKQHSVFGTYSNPQREDECNALPFPCTRISFLEHDIIGVWNSVLDHSDILIINIPPKRNTNGEVFYDKYIQQIISHTPVNKKIIFISSTSVYGNQDTEITEKTLPQPSTASGQALLRAEQALTSHFKTNITILRCSGLVGPKRHPGRFLAEKNNVPNPDGLVNLVHQKDCIDIISKLIKLEFYGHVLNLCSDQHPTRKEFYIKAARQLQLKPPCFIDHSVQSLKYIDNTKSKTLLNHSYFTIDEILEHC